MSTKKAAIAANRFGLGATPGQLAAIQSDPQGWLLSQLVDEPLPAPLAALPGTFDDLTAFAPRWILQYAAQNPQTPIPEPLLRQFRASVVAVLKDKDGNQLGAEESVYETFKTRYRTAVKARFDAAVRTDKPFRERLVHFWSNHFVVSAAKISAFTMPPSYERDTARAHVLGRFYDMLEASSKHPAMLHYLDNSYSIGPNSKWGKNPNLVPTIPVIGKPEGLNENLAREILELHTVGVNGGYTQADVRNFAKIITGWQGPSFAGQGGAGAQRLLAGRNPPVKELFTFNANAHEPGAHVVMGKSYNQDGAAQGEAVLRDLSVHPSTARFIAFKLARYFIADTPPPAAVDRIAQAFLKSGGDLKEVAKALVQSPEAWAEDLAKIKQPEEYLISAVRACGGPSMPGEELEDLLTEMGQPVYKQAGPDGWADAGERWIGPDPLWKRLEWANTAAIKVATTKVDPARLGVDLLGPFLTEETKRVVSGAESQAQGLALLLVAPEFLRR